MDQKRGRAKEVVERGIVRERESMREFERRKSTKKNKDAEKWRKKEREREQKYGSNMCFMSGVFVLNKRLK